MLKFAKSNFGKKAEPTSAETLKELQDLHVKMSEGGLVSKTAFIKACFDEGYKTREIADVLGMKSAVVYSMYWRVKDRKDNE